MLKTAINAAREAGSFLKENFGNVHHIKSKGDRNLATEIDQKAEHIIVTAIKNTFPGHGILAEENVRTNLENEWLWIIDPLDGTHNYIRKIDIYGVSIGLIHKGQFVLGVIYIPSSDEMYYAEHNNGAFLNEKKISVSNISQLNECSVSFDTKCNSAMTKNSAIPMRRAKVKQRRIGLGAFALYCFISAHKLSHKWSRRVNLERAKQRSSHKSSGLTRQFLVIARNSAISAVS